MKIEQIQLSSVQIILRFNFVAGLLIVWIWGMESDEGSDWFIHILCVLAIAILCATLSQEVIIYRKLRREFSSRDIAIPDRVPALLKAGWSGGAAMTATALHRPADITTSAVAPSRTPSPSACSIPMHEV